MKRWLAVSILLAACVAIGLAGSVQGADTPAALCDDFSAPRLDTSRWRVTYQGDFQDRIEDVQDGGLRLLAATIGTRDDTVKFHGVRTKEPLDLSRGIDLSFDVDWNNQANGCYLTAGVTLSPTATDANPADAKEWLRFEYIGVPPGQNARALLAVKGLNGERQLFTEGWPEKHRTGRKIGNQHVRLLLTPDALRIWENGKLLFETTQRVLASQEAYLYLQMSSHSNYPPREVYFDNIVVR